MSENNNQNPNPDNNNTQNQNPPKITAPKKPAWYLSITRPGEYANSMKKYYEDYEAYLKARNIADRISYKGIAKVGAGLAIVGTLATALTMFSKNKNEEDTPLIDAVDSDDSTVE